MANEIEIKVTSTTTGASKGLADVRQDAKKTGTSVATDLGAGFDKAEKSGKEATRKIGSDLGNLEAKAKQAGDGIGEGLSRGAQQAEQSSGKLGDVFESGMGKLGEIGKTGGLAVGALFVGAMAEVVERQSLTGLLAAQVGAGTEQAGRLGEAAGDAYADGFGESIEDITAALKSVVQSGIVDVDAPIEDLERLAEKASRTAQIIEEDVGAVSRAVSQMLRSGMVESADEGFDLLVAATQRGLNVSQDLLDTITEYGTQFRQLGLDGQTALGLIKQGVEGAGRDTDVAADALKEFALLAVSRTPAVAQAFEDLGLKHQEMTRVFATGGPPAARALDAVLDRLRAVEDPVKRNTIAVTLFGTKSEDLQRALMKMDVSTAAQEMDGFEDALSRANEQMNSGHAAKLGNGLRVIKDGLVDVADSTLDFLSGSGGALDTYFDEQLAKAAAMHKEYLAVSTSSGVLGSAVDGLTGSMADQVSTLDDLIASTNEFAGVQLDLSGAQLDFEASIDDASESLRENGRTLDINTEKGRANRAALNDIAASTHGVIEAMRKNGSGAEALNGVLTRSRDEFVALATKMTGSSVAANQLADSLGLIPGTYTASVHVDSASAEEKLRTVAWLADQAARNRTLTITYLGGGGAFSGMPMNTPARAGRMAHGGITGSHAAEGGPRGGRTLVGEEGPEIVDLAPGSMVTPAGATRTMLEGSAGGGGSWPSEIRMTLDGNVDSAMGAAIGQLIRQGKIKLKVVDSKVLVG